MNTTLYLEHANITVNDLTKSIHFFKTAFPSFVIRGEGMSNGRRWIHLGDDTTYLALNQGAEPIDHAKDYSKSGINHIGFAVKDVESIAERLLKEGFTRSYPMEHETFRIRHYFFDGDGNEFEFIEYLSQKFSERNQY